MLVAWLLAAGAGVVALGNLGPRLSSSVDVPNSSSQIAADVRREHFGESITGSFTVLFDAPTSRWRSSAFVRGVKSAMRRAARAAGGRASPLRSLSANVSFADLATELSIRAAQERAPAIKRAIGDHPETRVELTGFPVVSDDLSTIIGDDLRRAEMIALPITALILLLFFGSLSAAAIPLLFGLATISVGMGVIWLETFFFSIPIYATNVVTLVGIALAVDYSMLYVARYREEARDGPVAQALPATARTAGRALAISGAVVAAGLAPLAFVPIPFFSGLGVATIVIPVVSVLAAVTLLPALVRVLAPRLERKPLRPRRRRDRAEAPAAPTLGTRTVDFVMRRAGRIALAASALMLLIAVPAIGLNLAGSSPEFMRRAQIQQSGEREGPASMPRALYDVLIDNGRPGGVWRPNARAAERRLLRNLTSSREIAAVQAPVEAASPQKATRLGLADPSGRFSRIHIIGAHRSGSSAAEAFVGRLRSDFVPRAGFGASPVWVGGPSASDYDFVRTVEESIPLLVLALIAIMFVLLVVLLRSPVLPLKAIAMSAISTAAACGVLVVVFQLGWVDLSGAPHGDRIEAWVPVLLFAALFGISTDYEIFMVTRMREEWLRSHDNERAVSTGLRLVSGMITASALVMLTIFAGFTTSRVVALQQFGIGLVAGVFFDATVVRLLLVPSLMKLMGRWNWSFRTPRASSWQSASEDDQLAPRGRQGAP